MPDAGAVGRRVLVVDDHAPFRALARELLRAAHKPELSGAALDAVLG